MHEPEQKSLSVWTVFNPDSSDDEEEKEEPLYSRIVMEQKLEEVHAESLDDKIESMNIGSPGREDKVQATKEIIVKYRKVFSREDEICVDTLEHKLELSENKPIRQRPYKTNVKSQEVINGTVEELLKDGIITVSDSEWASPILLVRKKTGETCLCELQSCK